MQQKFNRLNDKTILKALVDNGKTKATNENKEDEKTNVKIEYKDSKPYEVSDQPRPIRKGTVT